MPQKLKEPHRDYFEKLSKIRNQKRNGQISEHIQPTEIETWEHKNFSRPIISNETEPPHKGKPRVGDLHAIFNQNLRKN